MCIALTANDKTNTSDSTMAFGRNNSVMSHAQQLWKAINCRACEQGSGEDLTASGHYSSLRSMLCAPGGCPGGQSQEALGSACAFGSGQRSSMRGEVYDAATGGARVLLRRLNDAKVEEQRDCGLLHQQLADDALQPQSYTAGHCASAARSHSARCTLLCRPSALSA